MISWVRNKMPMRHLLWKKKSFKRKKEVTIKTLTEREKKGGKLEPGGVRISVWSLVLVPAGKGQVYGGTVKKN